MDTGGKSKKIVIVEDNIDLAEIYKTRLELLGYTVLVASDGIAALYLIQKELPSLVLLDLMVPSIAGDQILLRMRTSDWGKTIPVVIISNLNEDDAPKGIRQLGISGYAVKANLSYDQLDQLVEAILEPKAAGAKPGQPPLPANPFAEAKPESTAATDPIAAPPPESPQIETLEHTPQAAAAPASTPPDFDHVPTAPEPPQPPAEPEAPHPQIHM